MASIPLYWHCEPGINGEDFQIVPWGRIRPEPSMRGTVFIDTSTGEVHSDAILMCALPWPRFRSFSTGKQVVLPEWMTETLERLETMFDPSDFENVCACSVRKHTKRSYHFRVECVEAKAFMTVHCDCTFRNELVGGPDHHLRVLKR